MATASTLDKAIPSGALVSAVEAGDEPRVRALLDGGADTEAPSRGWTPLRMAAHMGAENLIALLVSAGADPCAVSPSGSSPLDIAIAQRELGACRSLLEAGGSASGRRAGSTALHRAVGKRWPELVGLLASFGADLEEANDEGRSPLLEAVRRGLPDLAEALLAAGADPNSGNPESPLMEAACRAGNGSRAACDPELVGILVAHGADVEARNVWGMSPLSGAVEGGRTDVVEALLRAGASANSLMIDGLRRLGDDWTVLHQAASMGHAEIALLLLSAGADPNAQAADGKTPGEVAVGKSCEILFSSDLAALRRSPGGLGGALLFQGPSSEPSPSPSAAGRSKGRGEHFGALMALAESRGGALLSPTYLGGQRKLLWRCAQSHEWEALPGSVKSGSWCPACAREKKSAKRPETFEKIKALAESKGGGLLSPEYLGGRQKLKFRCSCGHEWEALPGNVMNGSWCPKCPKNPKSPRWSSTAYGELKSIAQAKGGDLLSPEYRGSIHELRFRCSEGHEWEALPSSVKSGSWCRRCAMDKRGLAALERRHERLGETMPPDAVVARPLGIEGPSVSFGLSPEDYEALSLAARKQGCSVDGYARLLVEAALASACR